MAQDIDTAVLRELQEQTRWLRLVGMQALRDVLVGMLRTRRQKLVYEYSDGNRTTRDITQLTGAGTGTVSRWWTQWMTAGICFESPNRPGRAQHLASLSTLGIEIPEAEDDD